MNLFNEYRDDIRIVGGWVPDLMFPEQDHVGSVDVDVLINHLTLKDSGYQTMSKILLKNGYTEHPEKYFSFGDGDIFIVSFTIYTSVYQKE